MWVFCESQQGKKARPSGPPGGASLLVNRNDVRPRYAGPKDESAGPGLLRTLQRAGMTTGPGRGPHPSLLDHTSPFSGARSHPAVHNHWGSGFTPGSVPAPAAAEPTAEPTADAEAATAAPATGDEGDGGTMAVDDDDEGAIAAAPQPGPALRSIAIQSRKRKGTPNPTLEGVRNAAGVGDTAAQPGTNAPCATSSSRTRPASKRPATRTKTQASLSVPPPSPFSPLHARWATGFRSDRPKTGRRSWRHPQPSSPLSADHAAR